MSQSSAESDFRFEGEISEPKNLIPILRAIHIRTTSVMVITHTGLKVKCQDCFKSLQANCFIDRYVRNTQSSIQNINLSEELFNLSINLSLILTDRTMFLNYYMSNEENLVNVCFRLDDLLNVLTLFGIKE